MRLVEVLQVAASILGVLASAFMVLEKRLVQRFRRAGAVSPETSIELPPLSFLSRWRLSRLESAHAVMSVDHRRRYLDEEAYGPLRNKRVVRGVTLVVLALAIVVLAHRALR